MTKVVINRCYGGFSISEKAVERFFELKQWNLVKVVDPAYPSFGPHFYKDVKHNDNYFSEHGSNGSFSRDDPTLIRVVEELGEEACGSCAELSIVEVPDNVDWHVEEYDGREWIAEAHRTWS